MKVFYLLKQENYTIEKVENATTKKEENVDF